MKDQAIDGPAAGPGNGRATDAGAPTGRFVVRLMLIIALSAVAFARNVAWEDSVSLWRDAAEKSPGKARANYELGVAYSFQGKEDRAFFYMRKSAEIDGGVYLRTWMLKNQ